MRLQEEGKLWNAGGADLEHLLEDGGDFVRLRELGEGGLELLEHLAHLGLLHLRSKGGKHHIREPFWE
jgi:hypothetical protein